MADKFDIVQCYRRFLSEDPDVPMPVAAIESLVEFVKQSEATTSAELMDTLKNAIQTLKSSTRNSISLSAGCDVFMQFVTRVFHDLMDFDALKKHLISRGEFIVARAAACRDKVAEFGEQFIKDDAVILIHSYSRVVMGLLLRAAQSNKRFKVYVTESRPSSAGLKAAKVLRKHGIPSTVVLDSAVGYIIHKVDMVLVGAEGVVENGGLINQIGTYQIAVVAKEANKPFYAVAESYKFVRLFPLNQYDLPTSTPDVLAFPNLEGMGSDNSEKDIEGFESINPSVDYTPPSYITLLFTDLGIVTPSGVSDELIKLHL
ncbi:uncharacterized protein VTP21DRAFT_4675 [Calcarisporiella thermophila]|uniref:uncharacterized protein n=1 Tax=Calcarisporiella thermophila TaxID=911321 RepID=UPI0037446A5D